MIRPLRQLHRRVVIALGVVVPVAFTLGIAARHSVPLMAALPAGLAAAAPAFPVTEWGRTNLFPKHLIAVRLVRDKSNSARCALAFSAASDFVQPDLLVYWTPGHPPLTDTLPNDATLLGAFAAPALPLPAAAATNAGVLVLYSLANNAIVDVSSPVVCGGADD